MYHHFTDFREYIKNDFRISLRSWVVQSMLLVQSRSIWQYCDYIITDIWPWPDLDLGFQNRIAPSKKCYMVLRYNCTKFGALTQRVTTIHISDCTNKHLNTHALLAQMCNIVGWVSHTEAAVSSQVDVNERSCRQFVVCRPHLLQSRVSAVYLTAIPVAHNWPQLVTVGDSVRQIAPCRRILYR